MKFINYLSTMAGIGIYPMISLLVFFLFFMILAVVVFRMEKKEIQHAGMLPLVDSVSENEIID